MTAQLEAKVRQLENELARLKGTLRQPTRPHRNQDKATSYTKRKIGDIAPTSFKEKEIRIIEDPDTGTTYLGVMINGTLKKFQETV